MRASRRIIALLIALATLFTLSLSLTSCKKNREYDETEVVEAAKELLPKAALLYSVYYGNGIRYIPSGFTDGDYCQADDLHLYELGFTTVEELKAKSYEVFSLSYCENIFATYLETAMSEDGTKVVHPARFTMNGTNEYMLVNKNYERYAYVIYEDRMGYDLGSVKALGSTKDYVNMSVVATVSNEEGATRSCELKFNLYEEQSGWRIAGPCFANYD